MTTALTTAVPTAGQAARSNADATSGPDCQSGAPAVRRSGRRAADTGPAAAIPWLSPVPDCEPPYDDELTGPSRIHGLLGGAVPTATTAGLPRAVARTAATSAVPLPSAASPSGVAAGGSTAARRDPGRGVRPAVVTAGRVPGWSRERDVGVEMTSSGALPRADRTGWMLAQALIEVLAGARPLAQLREHCAPDVFAGMEDQRMLRGSRPPRLLTARVGQPSDGAAEVAAVFRCAERVRAMAFRLQGIDGRWRITFLQIG